VRIIFPSFYAVVHKWTTRALNLPKCSQLLDG
jgi:hypothetical protein